MDNSRSLPDRYNAARFFFRELSLQNWQETKPYRVPRGIIVIDNTVGMFSGHRRELLVVIANNKGYLHSSFRSRLIF